MSYLVLASAFSIFRLYASFMLMVYYIRLYVYHYTKTLKIMFPSCNRLELPMRASQGDRYVYVVRNTCQMTPEVANVCLEMYISEYEEDHRILSKHRNIANSLRCPIIIDLYHQHEGTEVMLWYKTYTISHDERLPK